VTLAAVPTPRQEHAPDRESGSSLGTYAERLAGLVRPEFRVRFYWPPAGSVLAGGTRPGCRVPGCERGRAGVHGWCQLHHRTWQASGLDAEAFIATATTPPVRRNGPKGVCAAAGCANTVDLGGWCAPHYQQWQLRGRPADFAATAPPAAAVPDCQIGPCIMAATTAQPLCRAHLAEWRQAGEPDLTVFAATARLHGVKGAYHLHDLPPLLALELGYGLQRFADRAENWLRPTDFNRLSAAVRHRAGQLGSILDDGLDGWRAAIVEPRSRGFLRFVHDDLTLLASEGQDEWAKDRWDLRRLGLHGHQTGREFRFDQIAQPWLRAAAKRWIRHEISRDRKVGTLRHHVLAARQLSRYLAEVAAAPDSGAQLTRALLEGFLAWMVRILPHARTRNRRISCVKVFLDESRRFDWAPIPPTATIYPDDFPDPGDALPRALSEFVMAQLEHEANLALLPDDGTRAAVIVLMRTGLRVGDLIRLRFDPVTYDPGGAPYLDFHMHKLRKDHRIPIDQVTEATIRAQQQFVRRRWPAGSPWLFPRLTRNAAGAIHWPYATLANRLDDWATRCRVVDEQGAPVHVTPHRFRHTLGTRMINEGVAQHVVQRLYGHESPEMTAVYARLHDATLRQAFDQWRSTRVNIHGQVVLHDPGDEAAWVKQRLARAKQTLPNGYCGRPLQQACPHPNACLTCEDFLSDGQFLPLHRDQLARTRTLIAAGQACGNQRLVEMNQQVEANLTRMIAKIEELEGQEGQG
jgi:integrase